MIRICIDGFAQAMRAPQGVITPPLPKQMRDKHFVKMYSPAEVKKWQYNAHRLAIDQMKGKTPLAGMLNVSVKVYLPVPKSMSRKKTEMALSGRLRPITRPDADNYSKSICDSMTGVLWLDDAQIVSLRVDKWYADKPRVEIEVAELPWPDRTPEYAEQAPLFRDHDKGYS
jgi:Holliday junction resolvase RusA-like endonuclease